MPRSSSRGLTSLLKSVAAAAVITGLGLGLAPSALAAYTPPAKPLAIADIARYDALGPVAIAPDGKHIAALIAVEGQKWPVISIWDTSDLSKRPVWIPSETNRIIAVDFFSNDKIYFLTEQAITRSDGKPSFINKLYYADLEGRKIEEPFRLTGTLNKDVRDAMERGISVSVFNDSLYDDTKVLMETVDPSSFVQKIFELDTKTGKTRTVALGSEDFVFDPAGVNLATGEPMVKAKVDLIGNDYWYMTYIKEPSGWVYHEPLSYMLKQRRDIDILGFDTDPSKLIVASNVKTDKKAVYSYDIATKTFSAEPLFANERYDISNVGFRHDKDAKTSTINAIWLSGPYARQVFLDDTWAAVQSSLEATFPDKIVYISVNSHSRETAIVTVTGPDSPPQYLLYKSGKLQPLGSERPWIDPKVLGKTEFITYKARDGLEIPAYVTYPPGWTPEQGPVPLIVLPHGGPWSRDHAGPGGTWDASGWPHFFASRGIAVIQPQYRGSDGFGLKLWLAGDKEWGQKMQDDKDDAAAYLVAQGVADPKRMAIFGYSYGGFAAIAATVRPNSPYKCAIAGAGVSSLQRLENFWGDNHLARDIQGDTVKGMDPLANVRNANIPILLYHGDHDRQADTEHSRMFYAAMKAAGKDVEYHEIKGMWHTMPWNTSWQEQSLKLMEDYLKSPKCGLIN